MNVTVFGATGAIGRQVVDQLRSRGHAVTAYVRNPAKVGWGEEVTVVVGEITDAAAIDRAVAGADAVVSALGPTMDRKATGLPLVEGTNLIVAAMQRHGVHRYVGNGTPSVLDPREHPTWQTRVTTFMAKTFLRRAYEEMVGMSQAVMTSGLDWTIVRFLTPKGRRRPRPAAAGVLRFRPARLRCHPRRHRRLHRRPGRGHPLRRRRPGHQQLTREQPT